MRRRWLRRALLLAAPVIVLLGLLFIAEPHYRARPARRDGFVAELLPGRDDQPATVYVKGPSARRETATGPTRLTRVKLGPVSARLDIPVDSGSELTCIEILNARKLRFWRLDPTQKTYQEVTLSEADLPDFLALIESTSGLYGVGDGASAKHLGTETVNGYPCEKTYVEERQGRTTRWHSRDLNSDVRKEVVVTTSQGKVLQTQREEYRITPRQLPGSLFEIPKGYRRVPTTDPDLAGP